MSQINMTTPNVLTILKELSVVLGKDSVQAACEQFIGGKKKEKKERKPRGKSSWNLEVDKVLEEMQAAAGEEKVVRKMAFAEASRRRREGNPEAQAEYEAYRAKLDAKRADKAAKTDEIPVTHDDSAVYNFLFNLQESGSTNMLGAAPFLQKEFDMNREDANKYVKNYMDNYDELRSTYRPEPVQKKGRGRPKKNTTV